MDQWSPARGNKYIDDGGNVPKYAQPGEYKYGATGWSIRAQSGWRNLSEWGRILNLLWSRDPCYLASTLAGSILVCSRPYYSIFKVLNWQSCGSCQAQGLTTAITCGQADAFICKEYSVTVFLLSCRGFPHDGSLRFASPTRSQKVVIPLGYLRHSSMMFAVGASFSIPQDRDLLAHHVAGTVERRYQTDANARPSEEADDIGQLVHCRPASMIPVSGANAELPSGAFETTPLLDAKAASYTSPGARSAIRDEMKVLLKYSLPVFGTHLFEHSIMMATVISIGHISTVALAAATLGFMTANVTGLSILQGMANTLDTVLPPAWTSDQPKLVGLWTQRMTILVCVVLIPVLALWLHAEPLLLGFNQDPEIARLAGTYLKWASLGLPAYAFNCVSRRYFQSQGLFTVPTRIILVFAPINIFLNYLLVWGPEPFCLGFIGAPIAASISYNFVAIAFVVYGAFFVPRTAWHPITLRAFTNLGYLAKLSIGGIGQLASSWWSWEFVGLVASFLGPVPLATQSVLITTCSSFFQAPYAVGIATSVRIGNLLGERNAERARTVVTASFLLIIVLATLFSSVLITFRRSWGHLFNDDPEVLNLVAAVLPLVALVQIFDDTGAVVAGILRARGKQVLGATLNISAYYVIGLPIGLWLTFKRDFGLFGLWWGLNIAMAYGSSIGLYLCLTTDWDKEVEKVVERLAVDKGYKLADEERVH